MIDISGLDKAEVLVRLYGAAKPQGLGFLQYVEGEMGLDEARKLLALDDRFDYLHGRVMKISLRGDHINPSLYDRDNGPGAAAAALQDLIEKAA